MSYEPNVLSGTIATTASAAVTFAAAPLFPSQSEVDAGSVTTTDGRIVRWTGTADGFTLAMPALAVGMDYEIINTSTYATPRYVIIAGDGAQVFLPAGSASTISTFTIPAGGRVRLTYRSATTWDIEQLNVPTVTALPTGPFNGMEIIYQNSGMTTDGIGWHFRYNAAGGASKWEFVGGPAWTKGVATSESTSSGTFVALTTAGPSVALPLAGDYNVAIGASIFSANNSNQGLMSYDIGGTGAVSADNVSFRQSDSGGANGLANVSRTMLKAGLSAVTLTSKYGTNGTGTSSFSNRFMSVTPIRVG